jgi:3-isopropylmalate/(R)-2-methylmalate dehydratase large subunit
MSGSAPKTLLDKIWDSHTVAPEQETQGFPSTLYIDLHLLHEVTSPQAFSQLRDHGLLVHRPGQSFATMDHSTPTTPPDADGRYSFASREAELQLRQLEENCTEAGIPLHGLGSKDNGIIHVIAPELGLSQPGMTIVCGDSHTSTHGAFAALAFGIGTGQVANVLASQCLLAYRPQSFEIRADGVLASGVTAKDLILAIIAEIGTGGGTGFVLEYTGAAIRSLDMEQRMTVCNMSIEAGARAGLIAPDDTTFSYLAGRRFAPTGAAWHEAVASWRQLATDAGASHARTVSIDAGKLAPMVTYGTSPGMGVPITSPVPDPAGLTNGDERESLRKALGYMQLPAGKPLLGQPVDIVFVGSCTNSRLSDLRQAAGILADRKVAAGVRMLVVPGSQQIKRAAEQEGLHEVFLKAGAEWREPGCSMCLGMNGDQLAPGQLAVSTSNRNFEGRQGPGGRTILASPLTAAASAVAGTVADARQLVQGGPS